MRSKHRYSVAVTTTLTEICDVQCCAMWQCQRKYVVTILTATHGTNGLGEVWSTCSCSLVPPLVGVIASALQCNTAVDVLAKVTDVTWLLPA
jgi:hypothetical protein